MFLIAFLSIMGSIIAIELGISFLVAEILTPQKRAFLIDVFSIMGGCIGIKISISLFKKPKEN
ncbi:MAG: hypothetical protein LBE09_04270 [Christensenellaceae bacterium]|jgi:hypothetical protein|nr:hypothetical protein [Christensenellaceae bacterium]